MNIEAGKAYQTKNGRCVTARWWNGHTSRPDVPFPVELRDGAGGLHLCRLDGTAPHPDQGNWDIVAEWGGPGSCAVGDRVRCVADSTERPGEATFGRVGDTGTVKAAFSGDGSLRVQFDGAEKAVNVFPARFAKIETAAAAPEQRRFAVGDRVRVATERWGKDQHGKVGTVIDGDGDPDGSCPLVVEFDDEQPDGRDGGGTNCYEHADLEPWDGSAAGALRIEAGKLYRLKNGLCVGPIEADEFEDVFVWKAPQDVQEQCTAGWNECGEFDPEGDYQFDGALDIVAEWIGEPPVFKGGDRVVSVSDDVEDIGIGDEFEVLEVIGEGPDAEIRFMDNADDERDRPACRYRLAGAETQESAAAPERGLKAGDRIVSIDDDDIDISPGDVFTVIAADGGVVVFAADGGVVVFADRAGHGRSRLAQQYRLAEPDPDFSVGELIVSISDESEGIAPGDTFTATAIENRGGTWLVTFTHPISGERTRFAARYARAGACEMEAAE